MEATVTNNLALMKSTGEGGMGRLLAQVRIGGGGYTPDGRPVSIADFYFIKDAGRFESFGRPQDVPQDETSQFTHGRFDVAIGTRPGTKTEIVDALYERQIGYPFERISDAADIDDLAKRVIEMSIEMYNSSRTTD